MLRCLPLHRTTLTVCFSPTILDFISFHTHSYRSMCLRAHSQSRNSHGDEVRRTRANHLVDVIVQNRISNAHWRPAAVYVCTGNNSYYSTSLNSCLTVSHILRVFFSAHVYLAFLFLALASLLRWLGFLFSFAYFRSSSLFTGFVFNAFSLFVSFTCCFV